MFFKKVATQLFRFAALVAIVAFAFTQTNGAAQAQGSGPTGKEKATVTKVSTSEVTNYYGRLGDVQGKLGVVVELLDTPSALIYAESQGDLQASALAKQQTDVIVQGQNSLMYAINKSGIQATELYRTQKVFNGIWMQVEQADLQKLASLPGIKAIYPMIPKTIDHTTSVPLIGAPAIWAGSGEYQGEGIRIGIIDTGVDYAHTNFGGPGVYTGLTFPTEKVVGGWDFAGDAYNANDADPIIAPDDDPMDCNSHGTHVAGTAAGYGVLPDGSTYTESVGDSYADLAALTPSEYQSKFRIGPGVAPKADLYALRVFGCEGSTNLTELAIEWAMDPNGDGNLSDHLDVINMSLGSSFGSEYDTTALAANNAALAGIIVVASAGNSGDVYNITGTPGAARYAISVANTVDGGAVVSAMEVTAATDPAVVGLHPAVEAAFGPDPGTPGTTGDLVLAVDGSGAANDGCSTLTNAAAVAGKIALIDRGTCTFQIKVANAQAAGAIGALIANNVDGFPFVMAGTSSNIPAMMTTKAIGTVLKSQLTAGVVTVRLTSEYRDQFLMTDPAVEDTLVASSSRGIARGTGMLKPDLAAPGDSIFSSYSGSGNQGISYGGTSMASPHVAGMMALLRQMHPDWSVPELKALAMNTATNDIYTGLNKTGKLYTPSRIGAGRVSVTNAAESEVIAYYKNDPGLVSLSFGSVPVVGTKTLTKTITVENFGATDQEYGVLFDSRYALNSGLTFTVLDADGYPLAAPVIVPAGGTVDLILQVDLDATALVKALDSTVATGSRQRYSEGGGYVTLLSMSSPSILRVPAHIAARPASAMSVDETSLGLDVMSGQVNLTPAGTPVDTADDTSVVSILELKAESPNDAWSNGPADAADLQYVGTGSDYSAYSFGDTALFFGMATYGKWDTPTSVEFDIYIDANEDGIEDYVIFNTNQGFFTGTTDDVNFTVFCPIVDGNVLTDYCDAGYYTNLYSGNTNTNIFNNNVMTLVAPAVAIGLEEGVNTDFNYYVVTFSYDAAGAVDMTDWMSYDLANESFTAVEPYITGEPAWLDLPGFYPNGFEIKYNQNAIVDNASKGLLLLHHHNAVNTAEVIKDIVLLPFVTSIERAGDNPTNADSVDFTVTFSKPVTGVDATDFMLAPTSVSGAMITAVTGSGTTYTVTADTGTNDGTLGLNLSDNDSIIDENSTPLGDTGIGNGDFTGAVYNVIKNPTFADVPATHWAWGYIERLYAAGITGGCATSPDMLYCPDKAVTRAQMAIFLLRAEHGSAYTPPDATGIFADVPVDSPSAPWIEQLYNEGITGGCSVAPLKYCPDKSVTRDQMAIFLLRAEHGSDYVPPAATGIFEDVNLVSFTAPFIEQLYNEGVTGGCSTTPMKYCPTKTVTRDQMAVFLVKTFNLP